MVASFLVGSAGRGRPSALGLGLLTCLSEVAGYYVTAAARGFGINSFTAGLWVVAALAGGPVFGLAGRSWRCATGRERGLGAALLVAVWLCEAIITCAVVLGYLDDAVVFAVVAELVLQAPPCDAQYVGAHDGGTRIDEQLGMVLTGGAGQSAGPNHDARHHSE
jgi:hypothetical protein